MICGRPKLVNNCMASVIKNSKYGTMKLLVIYEPVNQIELISVLIHITQFPLQSVLLYCTCII